MFSIKAMVALGLTSLGAASVGTDAYLMYHPHRAPSPPPAAASMQQPAPRPVVERAPDRIENRVVMLDTVTITARVPQRIVARATAPKHEATLVPCSGWRPLESGPVDHGVRVLCLQ